MIINSILDTDIYKMSISSFILQLYPEAQAHYKFINRRKSNKFNQKFLEQFIENKYKMAELKITEEEIIFLREKCPYLHPLYFEYLRNFRFNPNEVDCKLSEDGDLSIDIQGPWHSATMWEVPLMAIISELYFQLVDTNWENDLSGQYKMAREKIRKLSEADCNFADFGTRRRRSFSVQNEILQAFVDYNFTRPSSFVGTSNVYFAKLFNIKPIGTLAHEIPMGLQVLEGIRNSNYYAMDAWSRVFKANLGTYLTDTVTTDQFLKNFNLRFAKLFDGVRQDSGNCFVYTDKIVSHYKKLGIDPLSKTIVFSDSLDVDKAIQIKEYCAGKIKCSFGIGTSFTNSFDNSPALNMVIKLHSLNNIPVVKLGDDDGKECGDKDALRVTKWIVQGKFLD